MRSSLKACVRFGVERQSLRLHPWHKLNVSDHEHRLQGKTCVITGATSGLGRAAATALGGTGANLILTGRRESEGRALASLLGKQTGSSKIEFFPADISNQKQVRLLAEDILKRTDRIDVLINNAGARFNEFQQSADGIELTFATNHIGHFLLTCLLLESLLRAKQARVITVGSGAHAGISAEDPWVLTRESYDRKLAYRKSKLANIVFAYELARRLATSNVVSNAVDPGGVATNLGRNNGLISWLRHLLYYALRGQLLTPRQGARGIVNLATSSSAARPSGKYFAGDCEADSSPASHELKAAARLWSLSVEMTRLNEELGEAWQWVRCQ